MGTITVTTRERDKEDTLAEAIRTVANRMLFLSRFQLLNHILELLFLSNCIQVFLLLACFLTFDSLGGTFLGRSLFDFKLLG